MTIARRGVFGYLGQNFRFRFPRRYEGLGLVWSVPCHGWEQTFPSLECEALDRALGVSAKRRLGVSGHPPDPPSSSLQVCCWQNRFKQHLKFHSCTPSVFAQGPPSGGGSWLVPASPSQEAPAAPGFRDS